jgi:hypothetical protein
MLYYLLINALLFFLINALLFQGFNHVDPESIMSENIAGVKDPSVLRRILEDRRLLLLSDPSNQEYKVGVVWCGMV